MTADEWLGTETPEPQRAAVMLVAILSLSNEAERERDPFARRMRLNEMQKPFRKDYPLDAGRDARQ